jgi:HlyD family secretion protein
MARWIWGGAGLALVLFLAWALWPRALKVETAAIDRGMVRVEVSDEGRTRIHDLFVIATPVSGRLNRIELEAGDSVARGQVVAQISPADPQLLDARLAAEASAAVEAARANLVAAEADLALARRDQERVAHLAQRGFSSAAALDGANAALRAARATVSARSAELRRAEALAGSPSASAARGLTLVRAPSAGQVLRLMQQSEAVILAGTPIMEIGDPRDVEIVAEFLSQDAVNLKPGAKAWIENWGGGAPLAASIERIEPFAHTKVSALGVEEQRVNIVLRLDAPAAAPNFGHGYRVDVRAVVAEHPDSLRAPVDALVRRGAGWSVYRVVKGRAVLTPVELGDGGGGTFRVVSSGLRVGDVVILFPGDKLADGARVQAMRAPAR